jgi:hypothetical protein
LDLESTAIAPLTAGKSSFALLAALAEIGAVEAAPASAPRPETLRAGNETPRVHPAADRITQGDRDTRVIT